MPVITALERQRQEDDKFEGTMEYRERRCFKNDVGKTGFEFTDPLPTASRVPKLKVVSTTRPVLVCFLRQGLTCLRLASTSQCSEG